MQYIYEIEDKKVKQRSECIKIIYNKVKLKKESLSTKNKFEISNNQIKR